MTTAEASEPHDIRPLVGRESSNSPLWLGLAAIVGIGLVLFAVLESGRAERSVPTARPRASDFAQAPMQVPPLFIPPAPREALVSPLESRRPTATPPLPKTLVPLRTVSAPSYSAPVPQYVAPTVALPPQRSGESAAAIVYDATVGDGPPISSGGASGGALPTPVRAARARATRLFNRETTVAQGTLIAAVLETALDSTQPGQTRALVSRDVTNVDGSRTLIPRGSRLFGEYRADLGAGQNRAQVLWTRLVRPDGVAIALDSPAADRLGRAGIGGSVNTHFFERLGNALLQSSVSVGTALASRAVSDSAVIVALPNAVQGATANLAGDVPKPTLTVRAGARISVFVARDLDFTGVERSR